VKHGRELLEENMAVTILLYLGTILIASEVVGKVGHLTIFITAPLSVVIYKYLPKLNFLRNKPKERFSQYKILSILYSIIRSSVIVAGWVILFIITAGVIVFTCALVMPIFIIIFVTSLVNLPNYLFNKLYSKLLRAADSVPALHGYLVSSARSIFSSLASKKIEGISLNEKDIEASLDKVISKPRLPFNGLLGLILITISFILELNQIM
jgi:hypothetical protein